MLSLVMGRIDWTGIDMGPTRALKLPGVTQYKFHKWFDSGEPVMDQARKIQLEAHHRKASGVEDFNLIPVVALYGYSFADFDNRNRAGETGTNWGSAALRAGTIRNRIQRKGLIDPARIPKNCGCRANEINPLRMGKPVINVPTGALADHKAGLAELHQVLGDSCLALSKDGFQVADAYFSMPDGEHDPNSNGLSEEAEEVCYGYFRGICLR